MHASTGRNNDSEVRKDGYKRLILSRNRVCPGSLVVRALAHKDRGSSVSPGLNFSV